MHKNASASGALLWPDPTVGRGINRPPIYSWINESHYSGVELEVCMGTGTEPHPRPSP